MQKPQRIVEDKVYNDWQFGTIEHTSQIREHGITIKVYNCLEEYQNAVKKLVKLRLQSYLSKSIKNNDLISLSMSLKFNDSKDSIINKAIDLSFFTENELPYCQKSFEALYNRGLESFAANKTKVELLFAEIAKAKEQLDRKLNVKRK